MNEGGPSPEMERMIAKIAGAESRRQQYSISFDVAEENRDKIKEKLTSFGVEVTRLRDNGDGDTQIWLRGEADKIKLALKWALRGYGENVKDYFEKFAKKTR